MLQLRHSALGSGQARSGLNSTSNGHSDEAGGDFQLALASHKTNLVLLERMLSADSGAADRHRDDLDLWRF
jgi:hypothetical protein